MYPLGITSIDPSIFSFLLPFSFSPLPNLDPEKQGLWILLEIKKSCALATHPFTLQINTPSLFMGYIVGRLYAFTPLCPSLCKDAASKSSIRRTILFTLYKKEIEAEEEKKAWILGNVIIFISLARHISQVPINTPSPPYKSSQITKQINKQTTKRTGKRQKVSK